MPCSISILGENELDMRSPFHLSYVDRSVCFGRDEKVFKGEVGGIMSVIYSLSKL